MQLSTGNYDIICLQMTHLLSKQDKELQELTKKFVANVRTIITDNQPLQTAINSFIPDIFEFRISALKWLSLQPDIDLSHLLNDTVPDIEQLCNNPRLAVLGENILFALRWNQKVIDLMLSEDPITSGQLAESLENQVIPNYHQFWDALYKTADDKPGIDFIKHWSHSSLYIEFITLAGMLISEENIDLPENTINELSMLIANAAQEYYAGAKILGIIPGKVKNSIDTSFPDHESSEEDHLLASLGLYEFAQNF